MPIRRPIAPPNTEHIGQKTKQARMICTCLLRFYVKQPFLPRSLTLFSAAFVHRLRTHCTPNRKKTPVIGLFDSKNYSKQIFISFLPRNSCRTRQRIHIFATKTEQNLREIALCRAITAGFLPISRKSSIQSYNS